MKVVALTVVFGACALLGYGWKREPAPSGPAQSVVPSKNPGRAKSSRIPDDVQRMVASIRRAKNRGEKMRAVVALATRLPVGEFERWSDGNYLEFLDMELEGIFYAIIKERWLEEDPGGCARFRLRMGWSGLEDCFARWMEADEEGALEYVRANRSERGGRGLMAAITALGRKDVARALALLDEDESRLALPSHSSRGTLAALSQYDREAVLAHLAGWNKEARKDVLQGIAGAWLKMDFAWVMQMLEDEGVGARGLDSIVNNTNGDPGPIFLENIDKVPPEWMEHLAKSSDLTWGNNAAWLRLQGRDGLSDEHLELIQIQAARRPWWNNEKRGPGMELVETGTWLSQAVRQQLVRSLIKFWDDDLPAARNWAESLDGGLREVALESLKTREEQAVQAEQQRRMADPTEIVRLLVEAEGGISAHGAAREWSESDLAVAVREAERLTPEEAGRVQEGLGSSHDLPPELAGQIAARALEVSPADEGSSRSRVRRVGRLGQKWAANSPGAAGAWVQTLPAGPERVEAARAVATEWARYSPSEVQAWMESLGENEQAAVRDVLE